MLVTTLTTILFGVPVAAMEFTFGGTDHRSADAAWIQADGEINSRTVEDFIAFIDQNPEWLPKRVRLNSPGGDLFEGIEFGEELRRRGFSTEVGNHEVDLDWLDTGSWIFTRRTPGFCASACAYAFMGGVERRIDDGSEIGVHQFSPAHNTAETNDETPLVESGLEQEVTSILLSYVLKMGVDGRILVKAGLSSPDEMYWIGRGEEARLANFIYSPTEWGDWTIETLGEGVIARSERADGKYSMSAICTEADGAYFDIFVSEEPDWSIRDWIIDQCLPAGSQSEGPLTHTIIGNRVTTSNISIVDRPGGFGLWFALGLNPVVGTDPSFLYNDYFSACTTDKFTGSQLNMSEAILIAFRNCIE